MTQQNSIVTEIAAATEEPDQAGPAPRKTLKDHARHLAKLSAQMILLVGIYEAGCQMANFLPFDLPGNILGMALLLILLCTHVLRGRHVGMACDFLVDNMSIFFIPAGVGIMGCFSLLQDSALKFAFVCVATTVIVFLATSWTVIAVSRLQQRSHERKANRNATANNAIQA